MGHRLPKGAKILPPVLKLVQKQRLEQLRDDLARLNAWPPYTKEDVLYGDPKFKDTIETVYHEKVGQLVARLKPRWEDCEMNGTPPWKRKLEVTATIENAGLPVRLPPPHACQEDG